MEHTQSAGPSGHSQSEDDVIRGRETSHGNFAAQAATSQFIKHTMHASGNWPSMPLASRDSLEMIAVKISRILNGDPNNPDHWLDIAGYAKMVHNILTRGTHL